MMIKYKSSAIMLQNKLNQFFNNWATNKILK